MTLYISLRVFTLRLWNVMELYVVQDVCGINGPLYVISIQWWSLFARSPKVLKHKISFSYLLLEHQK
jgi:hypothetical protein